MPNVLLVMIGGAIGAALRYEVGRIGIAAAYAAGSVLGSLGLLSVGFWLARAAA